jgi:hypothetical protein
MHLKRHVVSLIAAVLLALFAAGLAIGLGF